tara:strand:+ start:538 stop:702 length:165 start_codon:yes stop_codon:yes gene_type:complete
MSDDVYKCSAKGCSKTYRSPLPLSAKYPPTHEHVGKKVYTMKKVMDGQEEASAS